MKKVKPYYGAIRGSVPKATKQREVNFARRADTYTVISLPKEARFFSWNVVTQCTVKNQRTGTVREMSLGQVLKRLRLGLIRIDERIFMEGRK